MNPATATPAPRRRFAFTLIELLVVVSIIALLVSILLPALAKGKAQADAVACAANMKALMQGLQEYLAESDNQVPPNGIIFPKNGDSPIWGNVPLAHERPEYGELWLMVNGQKKVYYCPTDYKTDCVRTYVQTDANGVINTTNTPLLMDQDWMNCTINTGVISKMNGPGGTVGVGRGYWSYSINSVLNSQGRFRYNFLAPEGATNPGAYATAAQGGVPLPWGDPIKFSNINNSEFITFMEEGSQGSVASPFNDEVFDAPAYNGGDRLTDRHDFSGNVAYVDGHVSKYKSVVFNNAPPGVVGGTVSHGVAMSYETTRQFFPDNGAFANGLP